MLASFVLKYKSTDVKYIPPFSSTNIVWANGSDHLTGWKNEVCVIVLLSCTSVVTNLGTLVEIIVFCWTSNKPWAWNWASANVPSLSLLLFGSSVNLNSLVPVLNLRASFLGIKNEPITLPAASVSKAPAPSGWAVAPSYVLTASVPSAISEYSINELSSLT